MVFVFVKLFCSDFGSTSTLCVTGNGNHFTVGDVKEDVSLRTGIPIDAIHLCSGKVHLHNNDDLKHNGQLDAYLQIPGGKGGFGSMLRAIGAQIEKTTNKEACRDLSGRRLRDINEEKRLKKWIAKQAEREREKAERKRLRLERMRAAPHHEFHDSSYDKQRSNLAETISDSLSQGLQKKRKGEPINLKSKVAKPAVKPHLKEWLGVEDNDLEGANSSASDSEECTSSNYDSSTSSSKESENNRSSINVDRLATPSTSTSNQPSVDLATAESAAKPSPLNDDAVLVPSGSRCHSGEVCIQGQRQNDGSGSTGNSGQKDSSTTKPEGPHRLELENFNSVAELEELGLDRLKYALMALGMKCGGTLQQRAERLFSVKGLQKSEIDPSLLAKATKPK